MTVWPFARPVYNQGLQTSWQCTAVHPWEFVSDIRSTKLLMHMRFTRNACVATTKRPSVLYTEPAI